MTSGGGATDGGGGFAVEISCVGFARSFLSSDAFALVFFCPGLVILDMLVVDVYNVEVRSNILDSWLSCTFSVQVICLWLNEMYQKMRWVSLDHTFQVIYIYIYIYYHEVTCFIVNHW